MRYKKLFEPLRVGQMELRNRIVMPGMGTNFGTEDGFVTERTVAYYEKRSQGGAGLIIVEVTCVDMATGKGQIRQLSLDDDKFIPGMRQLAQAIKKHGAKAAVQLYHPGRTARQLTCPPDISPL